MNVKFHVLDVKFWVIQPKIWGSERKISRSRREIWGYTTSQPCQGSNPDRVHGYMLILV